MSHCAAIRFVMPLIAGSAVVAACAVVRGDEILVADRLTNSVYEYSPSGQFLKTVLVDNTNLNAPTGIQISPDLTKLYVASSQNNELVQYNFDVGTGTASNPVVLATSAQGINYPSSIAYDAANSHIYVSNLGGGVVQLNLDGTSAGPLLVGTTQPSESYTEFSGLGLALDGSLVVGAFEDNTFSKGGILKSNTAITKLTDLTPPTAALNGGGALVVKGNDVFITSLFASRLGAYNAITGAPDPAFTPATGLAYPESITLAPGGNSLLVGLLGYVAGQGQIARYSLTGAYQGTFAVAQSNPSLGFEEATSIITVPPPSNSGPVIGFFSHDAAVGTMVNSPAVQSSFQATLMMSGTDNLEAYAGQAHPTLSFGTTGVTAATDFDGALSGPSGSASSGSVSLLALPTSQTTAAHSLTFNSPVTAFGAYFLDGGQGLTNTLTLELDNTLTGTSTDVTVGTIGPNWGATNALYFGVTDATPFNRIVLLESNPNDQLYLDDITAGFENLQNLIIPANGIVTLEPTSSVGSAAAFGQSAPAKTLVTGMDGAQTVPEPSAIVLAEIGLASAGALFCLKINRDS
jgi:hypothetical protein